MGFKVKALCILIASIALVGCSLTEKKEASRVPSSSCDLNIMGDNIESIFKSKLKTSDFRAAVYMLKSSKGWFSGKEVILDQPVFLRKSSHSKDVASTQKIVAFYLLVKNKKKIKFPIILNSKGASRVAYKGESRTWWNYYKDRKVSFNELTYGMMSASSNGATFRAMELLTGSSSEYIHAKHINAAVKEILSEKYGLENSKLKVVQHIIRTKFTNAHGLNGGYKNHYSTPKDMAVLGAKILTLPKVKSALKNSYPKKGFQEYFGKTMKLPKGWGPAKSYIEGKHGWTRKAGMNHVMVLKSSADQCRNKSFVLFYSDPNNKDSRPYIDGRGISHADGIGNHLRAYMSGRLRM